jgi:sulfite exporter TauE/SafE
LLAGLLTAGLATGFTHCAAMCGPFVLAQTGPIEHGAPRMTRLARAALLPYHAGRVVTYTLLGALAGTVSGLTAFFPPCTACYPRWRSVSRRWFS